LVKWLNRGQRILGSTSHTMSVIATAIVILMMLLTTADVCLRYFFNMPIKGANELIESMMLVVVFLGLAYVQYTKNNISIDLLVNKFPQKTQSAIDSLTYIISFGTVSLMGWAAVIRLNTVIDAGSYTPILEIPVVIFQSLLTFGFLMLWIVLLWDFIYSLYKGTD
jgi:TRAP-type C4-dicarboxylate transport system permease small subunit